MAVIARLRANGDLSIAGQLYTAVPAFDTQAQIDSARQLDTTQTFDSVDGIETLLAYLFGISVAQLTPARLALDERGNLVAPAFNTGGGVPMRIGTDRSITVAGTLTQGGVV